MKEVDSNKLERISGGISTSALLGIGVAVMFITSIINGIVHPGNCN